MYNSSYGHRLSLLFGVYLGVVWLDIMVGACLPFKETAKWLTHFRFLPEVCESSGSFTSSPAVCTSLLCVYHSNRCIVWYVILVLISISLMTYDVEHLFMYLFAILHVSPNSFQFLLPLPLRR